MSWKLENSGEPAHRVQLLTSGRPESQGVPTDMPKASRISCSSRGDVRQKSSVQADTADHWGVTSVDFTAMRVICVKDAC